MQVSSIRVPVRVLSPVAAALEASGAWLSLPDRADPRVLDSFIARYPSSREANLAFSLRHLLLRSNPTPVAYHRFIAMYRDRVGAEQALYELYDILLKEDRLSGYVDFLRRYPESPLAQVAELRVHALAFAVVCDRDTIEDYEAFLRAFPRAAQVKTAQDRSKALSIAQAIKEWDDKKAALSDADFRNWRDDQANTLVTEWVTHFKEKVVALWGLPPTEPTPDAVTTATAVTGRDMSEKLVVQHQLDVKAAIITTVYKATDAARDFSLSNLDWLYFQHLATAIGELRTAVEREHHELAELVKGEFAETRRLLSAGFDQVSQEIRAVRGEITGLQEAVQNGLKQVGEKLDVLHGDLKGVQKQLREIDKDVNDVGQKVEQTNQALNRLDTSVRGVSQELRTLTATVRSGFNDLGDQVDGMREDVVRGFDRLGRAIDNIPQSQNGDFFGYVTEGIGGIARLPERAGDAATRLWNKAAEAAQQIEKQASEGASEIGRTLSRVLSSITIPQIVAFDIRTKGHFSLNLSTGCYYGEAILPLGGKLTTKQIANSEAPELDPEKVLQDAARALAFEIVIDDSDYRTKRTQALSNPDRCVYFSSSRFVRWAGPETIASEIAKGILTAGATWRETVTKVQHQILLEFNDIVSWLKSLSTEAVEGLPEVVLRSLLFGENILDHPDLNIRWVDIGFTYRIQPGIGTEIFKEFLALATDLLSPLKDEWAFMELQQTFPELAKLLDGSLREVRIPHRGFIITYSQPVDVNYVLAKASEAFASRHLSIPLSQPGDIIQTVTENAPNDVKPLLQALNYQSFSTTTIIAAIRDKFVNLSGLSTPDLRGLIATRGRIIDLRGTIAEEQFRGVTRELKLLIGNDPELIVHTFELDLLCNRFELDFELRHRHIWNIRDLPQGMQDYLVKFRLM